MFKRPKLVELKRMLKPGTKLVLKEFRGKRINKPFNVINFNSHEVKLSEPNSKELTYIPWPKAYEWEVTEEGFLLKHEGTVMSRYQVKAG